MSEKIAVDKMRDVIIVEKSSGNNIEKGSRFYCGCCGNVLGISKKKLTFPFSVNEFNEALKNKTFDSMIFGLYHKTCRHTMFGFKKAYGFISLENYNKEYE